MSRGGGDRRTSQIGLVDARSNSPFREPSGIEPLGFGRPPTGGIGR